MALATHSGIQKSTGDGVEVCCSPRLQKSCKFNNAMPHKPESMVICRQQTSRSPKLSDSRSVENGEVIVLKNSQLKSEEQMLRLEYYQSERMDDHFPRHSQPRNALLWILMAWPYRNFGTDSTAWRPFHLQEHHNSAHWTQFLLREQLYCSSLL